MGDGLAPRRGAAVAVVGAGYAGMAAAVRLAEHGVKVSVFEAGPVPGGRARRVAVREGALDNGQHVLVGAYRALFEMMRTVGVPSEALLRIPLEIRYACGFRLRKLWLPAPLGLAGGLLAARGAPLAERLAAIAFMRALKRSGYRPARDLPVAELLESHHQSGRIGRLLWRALCVSALNTPPELASARAFLAVLRDALDGAPEASDLLLPRVDLSRLFPEPAAEFVKRRAGEILLRSPVRNLEELRRRFAAVIVAVGPHQLERLVPGPARHFSYQPIYTCYLQYPERVRLPLPMLGLAEGLVQWVFDRGALTGERGLLACVISAQGAHQELTREALAARCHGELAQALPGLPAARWSRVIAEKRATITCSPHLARPGVDAGPPGVFLAGDYTDPEYPPTLEAAVRSGARAAQRVLEIGL